ncbi:MAG: hypothetical protein IPL99_24160 [Candidatus Competibacteraceae bacterium]|nr:hypothetical protein [Candidatus Competibacteraceae bacterium]
MTKSSGLENGRKGRYKLSLYYFMVSLIDAVINKTQSIRLLITEIKTNPDLKKLGFVLASPSMYSEAFSRYKPEVFQRIFAKLIEIIEIKDLPEIRTLGRFILLDGSLFPAFKKHGMGQIYFHVPSFEDAFSL